MTEIESNSEINFRVQVSHCFHAERCSKLIFWLEHHFWKLLYHVTSLRLPSNCFLSIQTFFINFSNQKRRKLMRAVNRCWEKVSDMIQWKIHRREASWFVNEEEKNFYRLQRNRRHPKVSTFLLDYSADKQPSFSIFLLVDNVSALLWDLT